MAKRNRDLLAKAAEQNQSRLKRRLIIGLVLLLAAGAGTIFLAHTPALLLAKIGIEGAKSVPAEKIEQVAFASLGGNYALVYPRRHAWWYSPERVVAAVQSAFPELATVAVEQTGATALTLAVTERHGKFLYCAAACYFMDQTGFVFAPAPTYSDHLFFEFAGAAASPVGTRPVPAAEFDLITSLYEQLAGRLPAPLDAARLYRAAPGPSGQWELLFDWPVGGGAAPFVLRLAATSQPASVAASVSAAVGAEAFKRDWQEAGGQLEYLDARFLPKIFYKFRE